MINKRIIRLRGTHVDFPQACLVCLGYPHDQARIERTFTYGRNSLLVQLTIPLCYHHHKHATQKSKVQAFCERISPWGGVILGAGSSAALLRYWSTSGQGTGLGNIFLAGIVGVCIAVTTWAMLLFWVAPLFASRQAKTVLRSVQLTRYDPWRNELDLAFVNATAAELTARENLSRLILPTPGWQAYRISARMLDHDIRYHAPIQTRVMLERPPSEVEARDLLQPVVEKVLIQQGGVDTFYELNQVTVEQLLFDQK